MKDNVRETQLNQILSGVSKSLTGGRIDGNTRVQIKNYPCNTVLGSVEINNREGTKIFQLLTDGTVSYQMVNAGHILANYVLPFVDGLWVKDILSLMATIYFMEWTPVSGFLQVFYNTSEVDNCNVKRVCGGYRIASMEAVRSARVGGM